MHTVLVAGATGSLGREVAKALSRKRSPGEDLLQESSPLPSAGHRVAHEIATGDTTNPESLKGVLDGVDAIISCLGAPVRFTVGDRRSPQRKGGCKAWR